MLFEYYQYKQHLFFLKLNKKSLLWICASLLISLGTTLPTTLKKLCLCLSSIWIMALFTILSSISRKISTKELLPILWGKFWRDWRLFMVAGRFIGTSKAIIFSLIKKEILKLLTLDMLFNLPNRTWALNN